MMTVPEHLEHLPSAPSAPGVLHNGTRQPAATPQTPAAAPPPLAPAAAHYVGVISALLLIAAGAVGIRDGIAAAGWISGPSWTRAAIDWFDGQSAHGWMVPVGAVLAAIGLGLVLAALKPRRRISRVRCATSPPARPRACPTWIWSTPPRAPHAPSPLATPIKMAIPRPAPLPRLPSPAAKSMPAPPMAPPSGFPCTASPPLP